MSRRWSLLPIAVGALHLLLRGPQLIDDAFISFRYAANLADGHGLVFNPGEVVEGYSNPLWTIALAVPARLGVSLPWTATVLGAACFLATVWVVTRMVADVTASPPAGVTAGLLVATSAPFGGSSLLGLETALFALGIVLLLRGGTAPSAPLLAAGIVVTGTSRPEGALLAAGLTAVLLVGGRLARGSFDRAATTWAAGGFALVVAAAVARRWAYGHWLPMSALAKRDGHVGALRSLVESADDGFWYAAESLGRVWGVVVVVGAVAGACLAGRAWRSREALLTVAVVAAVGFGGAVAASNGGDWMPFGRLLAPYLPPLLAGLTVLAVVAIRQRDRIVPGVVAAGVVLVLAQPLTPERRWRPMETALDELGRVVERASEPDEVYATAVLGRFGYHAPTTRMLDIFGLTEPAIGTAPVEADTVGKTLPRVVLDRRPALILHNYWPQLEVYADLAGDEYEALTGPVLTEHDLFLFVRRDATTELAAAIGEWTDVEVEPVRAALARWERDKPEGQG